MCTFYIFISYRTPIHVRIFCSSHLSQLSRRVLLGKVRKLHSFRKTNIAHCRADRGCSRQNREKARRRVVEFPGYTSRRNIYNCSHADRPQREREREKESSSLKSRFVSRREFRDSHPAVERAHARLLHHFCACRKRECLREPVARFFSSFPFALLLSPPSPFLRLVLFICKIPNK